MKTWAILLFAATLAGCAHAPPMPPATDLFEDAIFRPPSAPVDPAAALAISPEMRAYLSTRYSNRMLGSDPRKQLVDALYRGDLHLEYDATRTRTAAEAFAARQGNCLALVLMTSAFAQELGLKVQYREVLGEQVWDRTSELSMSIGHVNLMLEERRQPGGYAAAPTSMVVDFLPAPDAQSLDARPIGEATVVAMFLNNRAVESLSQGRVDDAYWWAREAVRTDPQMPAAYVTLGVVYHARHRPDLAEAALRRVTDHDPDNVPALSDRVIALRDLGRNAEAEDLVARLQRLDPNPPFSWFRQGMAALQQGRPDMARRLFTKEVERAPYRHEFEYWLAVSYLQLHDAERASAHLRRALEMTGAGRDRDLYTAKLARLKALPTP